MKWTRLELALLAKVTKYPLSMTSRERTFKLATIRTLWVSMALLALGLITVIAGASTASPGPLAAGAGLILLGVGLLLIAMILMVVVVAIFGN